MKTMKFKNLLLHIAGLSLAFSYDDLSYNKVATQSYTYSTYAGYVYTASSAVDRNTTTCTKTYDIGGNSIFQTVWWKVDLGGVYSIYSVNILFRNYVAYENRQRGRFAGFSLYISTTGDIHGSALCYKDISKLPPLNLTTTCTEHGRYIIFYNERIDGVAYPDGYEIQNVYTELCEVIVKGCNTHVYGRSCNRSCPINCKDSICLIQDGTCYACKPGWLDASCNTKRQRRNQCAEYITPWIVAFSIVLFIALLLITGGFVFFWIFYKRLFNGDIRLCWKTLFQANAKTTTDKTTNCIEPSNYQEVNPNANYQELNPDTNYQELKLPYGEENQYQNSTL